MHARVYLIHFLILSCFPSNRTIYIFLWVLKNAARQQFFRRFYYLNFTKIFFALHTLCEEIISIYSQCSTLIFYRNSWEIDIFKCLLIFYLHVKDFITVTFFCTSNDSFLCSSALCFLCFWACPFCVCIE